MLKWKVLLLLTILWRGEAFCAVPVAFKDDFSKYEQGEEPHTWEPIGARWVIEGGRLKCKVGGLTFSVPVGGLFLESKRWRLSSGHLKGQSLEDGRWLGSAFSLMGITSGGLAWSRGRKGRDMPNWWRCSKGGGRHRKGSR